MKTLPNAILTFALVLFGAFASGSAIAQHHGHGGGVRFGFSFGVPFYGPAYYPYAPYYPYYPAYGYPAPAYGYPPVAVAPASPAAYVEQGTAPMASAPVQAQGDWYYCADSKAYYPYVKECPAGWQRMPAQPPTR
jgi:hypothetical protein